MGRFKSTEKSVLVIGGAGYIGSHVVKQLQLRGHRVWVYDNLSTGHPESVDCSQLIEGDILDQDSLVDAMRSTQSKFVMHFAAFASVGESMQQPADYYKNNVVGSIRILDAMREAQISKIVFSSTTATYGNPLGECIDELTPQVPINPYGATKLAIERAIIDYSAAYGFNYSILRYFNAAGASSCGHIGEDHTPETHLIPLVVKAAISSASTLSIFGDDYPTRDGSCIRDYVHVEDLADAHVKAIENLDCQPNLIANLGMGIGFSNFEIVQACQNVVGRPIDFTVGRRRAGDPACLFANSNLSQKRLQWTPKYRNIESIIETAFRWHSNYPNGYQTQTRLAA